MRFPDDLRFELLTCATEDVRQRCHLHLSGLGNRLFGLSACPKVRLQLAIRPECRMCRRLVDVILGITGLVSI